MPKRKGTACDTPSNGAGDSGGALCTKSELNLFARVPVQHQIQNTKWCISVPETHLPRSDESSIDFKISKTDSTAMIDPNMYLRMQAKIITADDNDIDDADNVAPINLWLASLFKSVEVWVKGQQLPVQSHYPYLAYLAALFDYGNEARTTFLKSALFYPDTMGSFNSTDVSVNYGFKNRHSKTSMSKSVDLFGPIFVDYFRTSRPFLPELDIWLRFNRSSPKFSLMSSTATEGKSYKVKIESAALYYKRIHITEPTARAIQTRLTREPAIYPFTKRDVRISTHPTGLTVFEEDVYVGILPKRLLVGQVKQSNYTGSYLKNPLEFSDCDLSQISLEVNGMEVFSRPLEMDYTNNKYSHAYAMMVLNTTPFIERSDIPIDFQSFGAGYNIYVYDLSSDMAAGKPHTSPAKSGTIHLKLSYKQAPTEPIMVMTFLEFERELLIDAGGNVAIV